MPFKTLTVTGVNIKIVNYGEADKIVTVLTKEHGIIQVIAKGARKTSSQFGARMELLHCNKLLLRDNPNFDSVIQSETVIHFPKLREDYDKMMHSFYWSELINSLCEEGETLGPIFNLFLISLGILEKGEQTPYLYSLWFELKLLSLLGYECTFSHCSNCDRQITRKFKTFYLDLSSGSILCPACQISSKDAVMIDKDLYLILSKIKRFSEEDIAAVTLNENISRNIKFVHSLFEKYFCQLSEKKLKTLSLL